MGEERAAFQHDPAHREPCHGCAIRRALADLFIREAEDGKIGEFIDALIDAAAGIAAGHVLPGKEADEREVLIERIGDSFDHWVRLETEAAAAKAVKQ